MAGISEVNAAEFEKLIGESDVPVLVDFWAPWCAPCRMLAPILEQVADENGDSLRVVKVNIDDEQAVARKFNIRSIPTMLVFKGGEVQDTMVGAVTKEVLSKHVQQAISATA
ncbi:MAG: thioredoxin [Wenzhouxiangellaceae bacterium]